MKDQKNPLALVFLGAGILLFAVSFYLSYRTSTSSEKSSRLARVERETGQVFIVRSGFTQKEKIDKSSNLFNLDSVETNDTGEALLSFESAFRLKVLVDSLVTLEKVEDNKGSHVVLILKKGDIHIENFGREGELFIAKNGERVSALDFDSSTLKAAPLEAPTTPQGPAPVTQLTEEEISGVMASHKSSFFKCYTQLLQKDPQAKGDATLSFTIDNSGKLMVYDMTSAKLPQPEFKKCLIDVMSRVVFRPFQGPPVSTLFPIKFE